MTGVNAPQLKPGDPGALAIGNHVDDHDPRGMYGERQSEPTNILGERERPVKPYGSDGNPYGENQLPVPKEFSVPKVQVDERFGVLHQQQIDDEIKIVGLNTLAHHAQQPLPPGQGSMDQAALEALQPVDRSGEIQARRQRFDRLLAAYDQFAANIETNVVALRATDPAHFDSQFAHLMKINLPRSVPDATLQPGFTTMQAAILSAGIQPPAEQRKSFDPLTFAAPITDDEKLRPWHEGGYVGMSEDLAKSCGVPWSEVRKAEAAARAPAALRAKPSLSVRPLTDRYAKESK